MIKEALKVFKKYKQIKGAEQYVQGLAPLYDEIYKNLPKSKTTIDLGTAYGVMALACNLRGDGVMALDMTNKFTNLDMLQDEKITFAKFDLEKDKTAYNEADLVIFTECLEHLNSNPLPIIR